MLGPTSHARPKNCNICNAIAKKRPWQKGKGASGRDVVPVRPEDAVPL